MCDYVRRGSECEPKYGKLWEGVQILGRMGKGFRYGKNGSDANVGGMDGQEWLN